MTNQDDFSKYYKTISNAELLDILEHTYDYQPAAVEAAKKEFSERRLSGEEITKAKESLIASKVQRGKQNEKVKAIENKIKETGVTVIETLNPVQSGISSTEKTIRLIVIFLGALFLYQFIANYRYHLAYIQDISRFPLESILYLLPLILLPLAVFTFWRKKAIGWTLLVGFLTYSVCNVLVALFQSLSWQPSGLTVLNELFPRPSPVVFFIQMGFLITGIVILCRADIRQVFTIKKQRIAPTIGIAILLTAFLILTVLS